MYRNVVRPVASGLLLATVLAVEVQAHHPMGGVAPNSFYLGFVSGLAHPLIEFGHTAFIVAVGILCAVAQRALPTALWFVAASIGGCILALNVGLPPIMPALVLGTVALAGLALARGKGWRLVTSQGFLIGAGLIHGAAYAGAVIGSEPTAVYGYLMGFFIVQSAVAVGTTAAAYLMWMGDRLYTNARISGGFVLGVAATLVFQKTLGLFLATA